MRLWWCLFVLACGTAEPPTPEAAVAQASQALAERRPADATRALEGVEATPAVLLLKARALQADNDDDGAGAAFEAAQQAAPDAVDVLAAHGHFRLGRLRDHNGAKALLTKAWLMPEPTTVSGDDPAVAQAAAQLDLAILLQEKEQAGMAMAVLAAWQGNPAADASKKTVAKMVANQVMPAAVGGAKREFDNVLGGISKLIRTEPKRAVAEYEHFLETHETSEMPVLDVWEVYWGMGAAHLFAGDEIQARPWLDKALAQHPPIPPWQRMTTHHERARAFAYSNSKAAALGELEELLWTAAVVQGHPAARLRWRNAIAGDDRLTAIRGPELDALLARYATRVR
jgi:tetratricopeptide (TPR) repeat protein